MVQLGENPFDFAGLSLIALRDGVKQHLLGNCIGRERPVIVGDDDRHRCAVEQEMKSAIAFHLEGFREEGLDIPKPHSSSSYVEVLA